MLNRPFAFGLLAGVLVLLSVNTRVVAQWENIDTVEGPYGEEMTLTEQPFRLAEGLSVRAVALASTDTTRWALSFIGMSPDDSISLDYGGDQLPVLQIHRPDDGVGPTKVFVSEETFLTMAETEAVTLQIGGVSAALPDQLRREMEEIFRRLS